MKKSGLIVGGIAIVFALAITLLSPFFLSCITPILGIAAGYMAGVFDRYILRPDAVKSGAKSAALGGVGMLIGQVFGALINGFFVGPEGAVMVMRSLGLPAASPS